MEETYNNVSVKTSKIITNAYSTSFSLGIKALHEDLHDPIYSVYGFVRLADEIVDSFHTHNQVALIHEFEEDTFKSINQGFSLNPVLNSFQSVVNKFNIDHELIRTFLISMKMDLDKKSYKKEDYDSYIFGSAEAVGLMCLTVFCEGDLKEYESLKYSARQLGSAFQKINFLRDFKVDFLELGRVYFPNLDVDNFCDDTKATIEKEIEFEFNEGLKGIKKLPIKARFGVYLAYVYYYQLFRKIKQLPADEILNNRIRISNFNKYFLLVKSIVKYKLGLV